MGIDHARSFEQLYSTDIAGVERCNVFSRQKFSCFGVLWPGRTVSVTTLTEKGLRDVWLLDNT